MENSQLNKLSMKIIYTFVLVVLLVFTACNTKEENKGASELSQTEITNQAFDFGVWITSQKGKTDDAYSEEFKKYKNGGIDEILINTGTDPKELERLVPIATKEGLKVHAWIMAVNRPGDSIALQHQNGIWLVEMVNLVLILALM